MFKRVITPAAERALHRLPRAAQHTLLEASRILEQDPFTGEKLHGSLSFLYSFHFPDNGIQYRIAYAVDVQGQYVVIHYVGTRENFYERLRRLFR